MNNIFLKLLDSSQKQCNDSSYYYDVMTDALIWHDEVHDFDVEELNFMREVWAYRASIHRKSLNSKYEKSWHQLHVMHPTWRGFSKFRVEPDDHVINFLEKSSRLETRRLDRYEKASNGKWFPLSGRCHEDQ